MTSLSNKFAPDGTLALTSVWADEGNNIGEVANGGSTDDRTVILQGTGVPGAYIIVVHNGSNIAVTVGSDGHWQRELRLQPGQNEVVVRSISETTEPYFIEYAPPVAPLPQVVSVWADEGQVGEVGNGGTTDDRTVLVQGYGTPGTFIWIMVNGQAVDLGFSFDGKWQAALTLEEGRNEIFVLSSQGNSEPFIVDYVTPSLQQAPDSVSESQRSALVELTSGQPAFDALFSEQQALLFLDEAAELASASVSAPLIISDSDLLGAADQAQAKGIQVSDVAIPSTHWSPTDEAQLQAFH